jgi:hypothetical protein
LLLDTKNLSPEQREYVRQFAERDALCPFQRILDFSKIEANKLELNRILSTCGSESNPRWIGGVPASEKGLELLYNVKEDVRLR